MLATNEVGVPFELATKLTFPEAVTEINKHKVKKLIKNGPAVYPGANCLLDEYGSMVLLHPTNSQSRENIIKKLLYKSADQSPLVPLLDFLFHLRWSFC